MLIILELKLFLELCGRSRHIKAFDTVNIKIVILKNKNVKYSLHRLFADK